MNIDRLVDEIKESEGWPRYTNRRNDLGGPTKGGVTLKTLAEYRGRYCSVQDLRELTDAEAEAIYRDLYIEGPHFDQIVDWRLRWQVVDSGVLHGQSTSARWLQEAAGVAVDGAVGPVTLGAVNAQDPHVLGLRFARLRLRRFGQVIAGNYQARVDGRTRVDQSENASGWLNRATKFITLEAERLERSAAA